MFVLIKIYFILEIKPIIIVEMCQKLSTNPEFLSQVSVNFKSREKDWKAIKGLVLQNRLNKKYSFDILQLVLLKNARLRKSKLQNAKISI